MILILAAAAENICSNSFGLVYGLSHWSVCNQKNNLNPHQKSLHRRLPRQHSNRACATTATLWGIFECISNANSSLKFFGRWRWCRCRGRCRCRGCDSWSTCRICILRLYFLNRCLECQPRAHTWIRYTRTWIWIASMEMQMWLLADTFRDLLYSASSINSPAFQTNRRQDANQAKYICFCLRCFFWRLDSFNLINCQHVPRLFISHSIQTQSQAAYSNIRIRLTKE